MFDDPKRLKQLAGLAGVWLLLWCDWSAWYWLPGLVHVLLFTAFAFASVWWLRKTRESPVFDRCVVGSIAFVPVWHGTLLISQVLGWPWMTWFISVAGLTAMFLIGLGWAIFYVESQSRRPELAAHAVLATGEKFWNPLSLGAWYYRPNYRKLDQSLWTLVGYSLLFLLVFLLLTGLGGCRELYEMPSGGGEQKQKQVVKIQKIIEKKIVINPFSSIIFNPPPIEDVKLELQELTKHAYEVGYGQGEGAGFSGGTNRGKVRFIRLEYAGGDWDQDFGVGSDLNMLIEYGVRTGHKVHDKTESRRVEQLANFPIGRSPPVVYMTGQKSIVLSTKEIEILREYLLDKHGMIFADNGGSSGWHGQFFAVMQKILPKVKPVRVPLDHPVHQIPYQIPFLPYVAPHGGKDAWGWVVDGRLVCYYHPGDIGDAWADGHAGVRREIWEYCYQLGTNILFYGHVEYNKWLDSIREEEAGK